MKLTAIFFSLLVLFLTGCATVPKQSNIDFNVQSLKKGEKIGVYIESVPKITTQFPGASCLLCLGAAAVANSSLTKQVESFKPEALGKIQDTLISQLKNKGVEVVKINEPIKKLPKIKPTAVAPIDKDYRPYQAQYGIERLIVVSYNQVGVNRPYSAYIPTGGPHVVISANFFMVDLATNTYSLYAPVAITKAPDGAWDVSPKFPAVTNAFYQAEDEAVESITKPFK
jgi:hypothetical protein